jgi:phosphatidylethanolamine-binding protein (PEBP) family uncharacterized protein
MKVYINKNELIDNKLYPLDLFVNGDKPNIKSHIDPTKFYTIIIVDEDAPSKTNPINKYVIHLLVINNKTTIFDYSPPNPPENSGPHRYHILVYEQPYELDKSKIKINSKLKFDLNNFVETNKLKLFDKFMFKTEKTKLDSI